VHAGLFWEKPEGRRPLLKRRHRWEDNINVDLQEGEWVTWTGFVSLRIVTDDVNAVKNLQIP
jgi:hypothetical protein